MDAPAAAAALTASPLHLPPSPRGWPLQGCCCSGLHHTCPPFPPAHVQVRMSLVWLLHAGAGAAAKSLVYVQQQCCCCLALPPHVLGCGCTLCARPGRTPAPARHSPLCCPCHAWHSGLAYPGARLLGLCMGSDRPPPPPELGTPRGGRRLWMWGVGWYFPAWSHAPESRAALPIA